MIKKYIVFFVWLSLGQNLTLTSLAIPPSHPPAYKTYFSGTSRLPGNFQYACIFKIWRKSLTPSALFGKCPDFISFCGFPKHLCLNISEWHIQFVVTLPCTVSNTLIFRRMKLTIMHVLCINRHLSYKN